jgi:uncharacterized damage-inducible protein DinB
VPCPANAMGADTNGEASEGASSTPVNRGSEPGEFTKLSKTARKRSGRPVKGGPEGEFSAFIMVAMQPDHAKFLLWFLLPQLKSEQIITKKILCSVPWDKGGYKPDPKCMSALQLARHIAVTEIWFLDAVVHRYFEKNAPSPGGLKTGSHVAEWYDENFAQRIPLLEALSSEDLATPVDFIGLRNDPAVAYLNIAIRHSVHHRGQLSAYLRPMGVKVPAIYVESGDEPFPPAAGIAGNQPRPPAF